MGDENDNGHDDPEAEDDDGRGHLHRPPNFGARRHLVQRLAHAPGDVDQADGLQDHEQEVADLGAGFIFEHFFGGF